MKRAWILLSFIVLAGMMLATTFNTPVLDGSISDFDDWEMDEVMMGVTNIDGCWYDLWMTWDETNFYVGLDREDISGSKRFLGDNPGDLHLFVAFDDNNIPGFGATSDGYGSVTWSSGTTSYHPEVVVYFAGGGGWAQYSLWDGIGWNWMGWSNDWGYGGWDNPGNYDDEFAIPWARIGMPTGVAVRAWVVDRDTYDVLASWPMDNPNGDNPDQPWAYPYFEPNIPSAMPSAGYNPSFVEVSLPVTLSGFNAVLTSEDNVLLQWITESESDMHGYEVYRSETSDLSDAFDLGFVQANNISTQQTYEYVDLDTQMDATYYYWLEARELGGSSNFFGPQAVTVQEGEEEEEDVPDASPVTTLLQNSPNPFNPTTAINYYIAEDSEVTLKIYNMKGQLINTLIDHKQRSGGDRLYSEVWESKDQPSGLYFYQLTVNDKTFTRKMMLLK